MREIGEGDDRENMPGVPPGLRIGREMRCHDGGRSGGFEDEGENGSGPSASRDYRRDYRREVYS